MSDKIYCLMSSGLSLTNEIRTFLYKAACLMFRKGESRKSIKTTDYEALLQTSFQYGVLGSVGGTRFSAVVETDGGKGAVEFIVRDGDLDQILEHCEWEALPFGGQSDSAANALLN